MAAVLASTVRSRVLDLLVECVVPQDGPVVVDRQKADQLALDLALLLNACPYAVGDVTPADNNGLVWDFLGEHTGHRGVYLGMGC